MNHFFPEINIHIVAGTIGLLLGLIPILSVKGGRVHRRFGKVFALFAFVVLLTSVISIILRDKPTVAMLSRLTLMTSYMLFSAYRALKIARSGPDFIDAGMAIAALLGAGVLSTYVLPRSSVPLAVANATLIGLAMVALYDLSRFYWKARWIASAAFIDHGVKMLAVFFGMLSAGAGNLFKQWQPWSSILPNVLGVIVMVMFAVLYFRKSSIHQNGFHQQTELSR
ncbi:hypothetical protein ACO0LF_18180 [Undibacterium sp. Di27W]|uniref:hypothetical protein n=1 Tax=Undibacterium sp. Di27W TaxID=3413036 RepID=UPI003BF43C46